MATRNPERYQLLLSRLRRARADRGLQQSEVAAALGVAQQYVSRIETGDRRIDPTELQDFSHVYDLPLSYFLGSEAPSHKSSSSAVRSPPAKASPKLPATITDLLREWSKGDDDALDEVVVQTHDELKRTCLGVLRKGGQRMALQPTELLDEVFIRLRDLNGKKWPSRGHFFSYAARIMRRVVTDLARAEQAKKRGGDATHVSVLLTDIPVFHDGIDEIALDQALDWLESFEPQLGRIVELRVYAGQTEAEIAGMLNVSPSTVQRRWAAAKRLLHAKLTESSQ